MSIIEIFVLLELSVRCAIVGDMFCSGLLECPESASGEGMFFEDFYRRVPDGKAFNGALASKEMRRREIKSLRLPNRKNETGCGKNNDAYEAVLFARYHDDSGAGQ